MKITQVLNRQNLGRMIKFNWFAATKKKIVETHAEHHLEKKGVTVLDSVDLLKVKMYQEDVNEYFKNRLTVLPPRKDENHPLYKVTPCLRVHDHDLLVQGVDQAQNLTKTVIINNGLPQQIEQLGEDTSASDETVQRIIRASNIFDAHQEKLTKKKDSLRPAWVFPRDYGITDVRKCRNLTVKMFQLCESLCGLEIAKQRQITHEGLVQLSIPKDSDLLKFNVKVDFLMTSKIPLKPIASAEEAEGKVLPDISPLLSTVGFQADHFYDLKMSYPIAADSPWCNAHTLVVYHDCVKVKNRTELPIKTDQLFARALVESFATAAASARLKYGDDIKDLPTPFTIQCIYVDGQNYHFSVFQLNTLNIDGKDGKMNFWWSLPQMKLFEKAEYENGKPVFEGYNPEVFKRILAFYKNT